MGLIGLVLLWPVRFRTLLAVLQAGAGHSFAEATFLYKVLFQAFELLIQQEVRLMK